MKCVKDVEKVIKCVAFLNIFRFIDVANCNMEILRLINKVNNTINKTNNRGSNNNNGSKSNNNNKGNQGNNNNSSK